MKNVKLVRSRKDKMLCGIFGGLSPLLNIDSTILRLAYALITIFTGVMPGVFIYFLCAIIIPLEDKDDQEGSSATE